MSKSILAVAREVRQWAEDFQQEHPKAFPRDTLKGLCAVCAVRLFVCLQRAGHKPTYVENGWHAFVLCRGWVVDIAATQFGDKFDPVCMIPQTEAEESFWELMTTTTHLNTVLHLLHAWSDNRAAPFLNDILC